MTTQLQEWLTVFGPEQAQVYSYMNHFFYSRLLISTVVKNNENSHYHYFFFPDEKFSMLAEKPEELPETSEWHKQTDGVL